MSERKIIQGAKTLQGLVKKQSAKIAKLEAENADYFDTVAELRKELSTLAIESVNREKVLAKLEAEVSSLREKYDLEIGRLKTENARLSVNPGKNLFGL